MDKDQRRTALLAMADFWRCPNNGKIIEGMKGDDKVLCNCGKPNPNCPTEAVQGLVHHVKRFLSSVTVDEYIEQEEKKRGFD
jgi:hypothetical protein